MRVHMIGIGGAGMSGIARVLHTQGHEVTGSDLKESYYTRQLEEAGVKVYIGHAAENLGAAERVVISTAIPPTNPELLEARKRDLPVIRRAGVLAEVLNGGRGIAIAGTHGKTTTTSMTSHLLHALGEDPTALIGGQLNDIGSNAVIGKSDLIVAEADESDKTILMLNPEAAVITNVEFDHPDFYDSLEEVLDTFGEFVDSIPASGHLIVCADDPNCLELAARAACPVTTYGIEGGELRAEPAAHNSYTLFENGEERGEVNLSVFGRHNMLNSLAAVGVARWLGYDALEAARHMESFTGVRRRFQLKGTSSGIQVIDDYAHHPTELRMTLDVARSTSAGRVIAVFQPHRYSRTRSLHREFGESFSMVDAVLITDVYGSGETPIPGVSGKLIVDAICESESRPPDVYYVPEAHVIPQVLRTISRPDDMVLTLGAGDITWVGEELLETLSGRD
jgi:UDP-N-acetylmuramate--alanine ligase